MQHSNFKNQLELAYKFVDILKWDLSTMEVVVTDYEVQFKQPFDSSLGVTFYSTVLIKKPPVLKNKLLDVCVDTLIHSRGWATYTILKSKCKPELKFKTKDIPDKDELFNKSISMNISFSRDDLIEMYKVLDEYNESVSVMINFFGGEIK